MFTVLKLSFPPDRAYRYGVYGPRAPRWTCNLFAVRKVYAKHICTAFAVHNISASRGCLRCLPHTGYTLDLRMNGIYRSQALYSMTRTAFTVLKLSTKRTHVRRVPYTSFRLNRAYGIYRTRATTKPTRLYCPNRHLRSDAIAPVDGDLVHLARGDRFLSSEQEVRVFVSRLQLGEGAERKVGTYV